MLRDFNPGCFVHARDFHDLDALADFVLALDADHERQIGYVSAPVFKDDRLPDCLTDAHITDPIIKLLGDGRPGKRVYRERRVREHVHQGRSWLANKWEQVGCKLEANAWQLGWRL